MSDTSRMRLAIGLRWTAVVLGIVSLVIASLLLFTAINIDRANPLDSPTLVALKQRLAANSQDATLAEEVRSLDLLARGAFFLSQERMDSGLVFLLLSFAGFAVCLKLSDELKKTIPDPSIFKGAESLRGLARSRKSLTVFGLLLVAGIAIAAFFSTRDLASDFRPLAKFLGLSGVPAKQEFLENWPQFRGYWREDARMQAEDRAIAAGALETEWSVRIDPRNEKLDGNGSPALWGDRIYLSAASPELQKIYAFSAKDGSAIWARSVRELIGKSPTMPDVREDTGYAAPSVATDGSHVIALFASGHLICLDREGRLLWYKDFGIPDNGYGIASSPVIWQDILILQYDQENISTLMGFTIASGKLLWHRERSEKPSWASPLVVDGEGSPFVIVSGNPTVEAFDPDTGTRLWSFDCMDTDLAPSPEWGGGLCYAMTSMAGGFAIDPRANQGQAGEAWTIEEGIPDISSPLYSSGRLYYASSRYVSCADAKSGTRLWRQRFDADINASPISIGGAIIVIDKNGTLYRFKDSGVYEDLGGIDLGRTCVATPAYSHGALYIRAGGSLFKITAKSAGDTSK